MRSDHGGEFGAVGLCGQCPHRAGQDFGPKQTAQSRPRAGYCAAAARPVKPAIRSRCSIFREKRCGGDKATAGHECAKGRLKSLARAAKYSTGGIRTFATTDLNDRFSASSEISSLAGTQHHIADTHHRRSRPRSYRAGSSDVAWGGLARFWRFPRRARQHIRVLSHVKSRMLRSQ